MRWTVGMAMATRVAVIAVATLAGLPAQAGEPYPPVAVAPVSPVKADADMIAFLDELLIAARARDREALARSLAPDFFWERDLGGGYDAQAGARANFESALSLNGAELAPEYEDMGWERLQEFLQARSFSASSEHPGQICGPAVALPADPEEARRTAERLDSPLELDWVYVEQGPVAILKDKDDGSQVLAELSWQALRVTGWDEEARTDGPPTALDWVTVDLPDGRTGHVRFGRTMIFLSDRLCYGRGGDGRWRITGYIGGGD